MNERELGLLCGLLSKEVEAIAERYMAPSVKDLALIRKLSRVVLMALKLNVPPGRLQKETRAAAKNHLQREREAFGAAAEIRRSPSNAPVETVDEPVIEILPLNKGRSFSSRVILRRRLISWSMGPLEFITTSTGEESR